MKLDPEIMIPPDLRRLLRDIQTVHPNPLNARTHSRKQRRALAKIIRKVGFINPIVVDGSGMILAGHGRHDAAQELGMTLIPVIVLSEMTEVQKRAYALADNQLATLAGWDRGLLATELGILSGELSGLGLTVTDLGFAVGDQCSDRGSWPGDWRPGRCHAEACKDDRFWSGFALETRTARARDPLRRCGVVSGC